MIRSSKARIFWPVLATAFSADCVTKRWAEASLPERIPQDVLGHFIRFTLAHNPGAAMGLPVGTSSRLVLSLLAVAGVAVILWIYARSPDGERLRAASLGLIAAGALGNLVSRLTSPSGVTDFIDVGLPAWRFWTFNVADACITIGAVILVFRLAQPSAAPTP